MKPIILVLLLAATIVACGAPPPPPAPPAERRIDITTPVGDFQVYTRRVGDNPKIKVLLLHGGPSATSDYFEVLDKHFPGEGFEYYYYNQLGSYRTGTADNDSLFLTLPDSLQPNYDALWTTERFVEEVEQVRIALGLDSSNFYLLGHSWGGILATEYALKYQQNLKGLVISNMMASCPAYDKYAAEVLGPKLEPEVLAEIQALEAAEDYYNPRYTELVNGYYYTEHILRMPLDQWPDAVNRAFANMNYHVYKLMQGPSEFGISGRLETWDRSADLGKITVPTLVVGAEHDTMDPKYMEWMATQFPQGRYLYCPNGSHMAMWDDEETYVNGLIRFIKDVDAGTFAAGN